MVAPLYFLTLPVSGFFYSSGRDLFGFAMLHVAPLSQDSPSETPDTKRFANLSKTSFYSGSQNILLFIGLAEETRLLPALCLGWYFSTRGRIKY